MNRVLKYGLGVAVWWASGGSAALGEVLHFRADLDGACAATESSATGTGTFTLDTATGFFQYEISYSGLSSPEQNAHIHGPIEEACGSLGGGAIVVILPGGNPKNGATVFTSQQQQELSDGLYYVNIHTVNFSAGEIAGVILPDEPTPAMSTWGMLVLMVLFLTAGTILLPRKPGTIRA